MISVQNKAPGEYSFESIKENLALEEDYYEEMQGYLYLKDLPPVRRRRRYNNLSMVFKVALKRQRRNVETMRKGVELAQCLGRLAQQS